MRLQDLVVALVRACAGRVKDDADVLELGHRDKAVDPLVRGRDTHALGAGETVRGRIPTMTPISSTLDRRMILIIRSVPMLPEPMMATLSYPWISALCVSEAARADAADAGNDMIAGIERNHRSQSPGQKHVPGLERFAARGKRARKPGSSVERIAQAAAPTPTETISPFTSITIPAV
jgi:hypothetical protein